MLILIVDDEQVRHDMAEQMLTKAGHTVLHAFSCEEGKEILQAGNQRIGLLLLDHDMGMGGSGSDLAGFILNELDPERFPAQAVSHSWNSDGAANIAVKLRTAGIPTRIWSFASDMLQFMILSIEEQ
jgi:CheY-like chemotaxis protein